MNAQFETTDEETTVISAPDLPEIPENVDILEAKQIVSVIEQKVNALPIINKYSVVAYEDLAKLLGPMSGKMEQAKLNRTKKLREEVSEINAAYKDVIDRLDQMVRRIRSTKNEFLEEQRRIEAAEQAKLNAEAEQKRIAAEQEAEKNRLAAEAARAQGNEKEAVKLENKANLQELRAANTIAPTIQQTPGRVTSRETWNLLGWEADEKGQRKPLACTSPLLKSLIGDMSQLPEGVQFILRHSAVMPTYLNASFGREAFPSPFTKGKDFGSGRR